MTDATTVPKHVGFIPDGNRRWAKQHGLPTYEGHLAGYEATKVVLLECLAQGVEYASMYAFSTENWRRAKDEVSKLMALFFKGIKSDINFFLDNQVRLIVVGIRSELSAKLLKAIEEAEAATAHLTRGTCVICINYGGQQEITDAVKQVVHAGTDVNDLTPELIEQYLYAPEVPPMDLVVRTSGEKRLSNFMLWRSAYSELVFIEDKHWPDMRAEDVQSILDEYARRNRRFGG